MLHTTFNLARPQFVMLFVHFRLATGEPKKVKERAKDFLQELNLERLSRSVAKAQGLCLEPFFSIKTHKPEQPFPTIISDNGTWQVVVSTFLQKQLEKLVVQDPFIIRNSEVIVEDLRHGKFDGCTAFSVDVVDLYYSLPQRELMNCVKECITENNDEQELQNECGLNVERFLELLMFYLQSTFIVWEGKTMVQKAGGMHRVHGGTGTERHFPRKSRLKPSQEA